MKGVTQQRPPDQRSMAVERFRVRRWTEFTWASSTADPEMFVRRAADVFQDALRERYPDLDCQVEIEEIERVAGRLPQLVFSMTVYAETEVEAMRRGSYRFERALRSSVPIEGRPRRISLPWGKIEAEEF